MLFLQYLVGMTTNLFVDFPSRTASVNPLEGLFTIGPYVVLIHFVIGLALGLLSIGALIVSALTKSRRLAALTLGGSGAIVLAGESGIEFVLGWYSDDLFSFLMSLGFILAFTTYFLSLQYASQVIQNSRGVGSRR